MNDDDLFPTEPQTSEPQYDWKDVSDGGVRHSRPLDRVRHTSCGVIETDASGLVVRVAGHLGRPCTRDERDPSKFVEWEPNAPAPTREQVLEQPGFIDCDDHPFPGQAAEAAEAEDAAAQEGPSGDPEPHVPQPGDPKPDGDEAAKAADGERRTAEATVVSGEGQHGGAATDAGDGEAATDTVDESRVDAESTPTDETSGAPE